ncbi:hypothetical protein HYS82_01455 [Candidatus Amesbacteria bacterium]|nr:hypothetical protein [Candidatus Amesbacteria bacterium]
MLKDLAVAITEAAGLKALLPHLAKLARATLAILLLGVFFSLIGIVTTLLLLYRLAVKPANSAATRIHQIELRLDRLEQKN